MDGQFHTPTYAIHNYHVQISNSLLAQVMYVPSWVPGAGFKRWANEARQLFLNIVFEPYYEIKKDLVRNFLIKIAQDHPTFILRYFKDNGTAVRSFVQHALESGEDEASILSASGSLFSGT